jgi:hypothetical protein
MERIAIFPETDWATEFGVYALNTQTNLFENTSGVQGIKIEIHDEMDEGEVSDLLAQRKRDGLGYDYALYDGQHCLVGFASFNY